MDITYSCNGPRADDDSNERVGCGADLTELILDVDEDGEVHEVTCPECENVATVRRTPPADDE